MESENLHDLRLDIKKLNALNELLDSTRRMHAILYSGSLRKFFRHMGRIRTAEINLGIFDEFRYINHELEQQLRDLIQREHEKVFKSGKSLRRELRKLKSRFEGSIEEVKKREVFSYCNKILQNLNQFFATPLDTRQLHERRKEIKNLIYTKKLMPKPLLEKISINNQYLDQLQEDIGRWHDITVAMQLLSEKKLMNELVYCMLEERRIAILKCIAEQIASADIKAATARDNQPLLI